MAEIEKVIVTKDKLDTLTNSISVKSGKSLTEMISTVPEITN